MGLGELVLTVEAEDGATPGAGLDLPTDLLPVEVPPPERSRRRTEGFGARPNLHPY